MKDVIELLGHYEKFKIEHPRQDLEVFADWLKHRFTPEQDLLTDEQTINEAGLEVMFSYLLGGLAGYFEVWVKRTFADLPLRSLADFGILKSVAHLQQPSKKEVVQANVIEPSTCIEIIKRLTRDGVFQEHVDEQDRRIRRVSLTNYGHEIDKLVDERMTNLGRLFTGNLNEMEMRSLIPTLKRLVHFHQQLYQNRDQ
ncbi:MAG: MarR family transcriptional regulator [Bacteroidota bacterium]